MRWIYGVQGRHSPLNTIFDNFTFYDMERVEKVFYNDSNMVFSSQRLLNSGTGIDINNITRILEEKDRKIDRLNLRLAQESRKLWKSQYHWERLRVLINSTDYQSSQLSYLQQIFQDYKDDVAITKQMLPELKQQFICRLKKGFPSLSSNDLRICTLLRQNLSTKEVAQNLAIGADSANKARYRIRKKLGLSRKDDLIQFILGY